MVIYIGLTRCAVEIYVIYTYLLTYDDNWNVPSMCSPIWNYGPNASHSEIIQPPLQLKWRPLYNLVLTTDPDITRCGGQGDRDTLHYSTKQTRIVLFISLVHAVSKEVKCAGCWPGKVLLQELCQAVQCQVSRSHDQHTNVWQITQQTRHNSYNTWYWDKRVSLLTLCLKKGTPTLSIVTFKRIRGFWRFLAQIFLK